MPTKLRIKRKIKIDNYKNTNKLQNTLIRYLDQIPDCVMLTDLAGHLIYVNKSIEIQSGYTSSELLGNDPGILNAEENAETIQQDIYNNMKQFKNWSGDILQKRKDGSTYLAEFDIFPVLGKDSNPVAWGCIQRDITKRKQAEEQLKFSEERFATAFNLSPDSMTILNYDDWRFIEVNRTFSEISGYSYEEVIGRTPLDINIYPNPVSQQEMMTMLKDQGFIRNHEVKYNHKNGDTHVGLVSIDTITLRGKRLLLTTTKDITQQKKLEEEMAQLGRLEVVGQMAAGIGHEVRNPMTTVRGLIQLLSEKQECSKFKDSFNIMIDELDRANSIITEFLSLAKNKQVNKANKNLNDILDEIYPLVEATALNNNVNIIMQKDNVPNLLMNEKEIRQLILNIFYNSVDEMPNGGNLTFSTYARKNNVVLAIKDEGKGIDPAILSKLGTPFITSKDHGTGLGLAICYGIAARHNAIINVDTSSNGTTFFINFPMNAV